MLWQSILWLRLVLLPSRQATKLPLPPSLVLIVLVSLDVIAGGVVALVTDLVAAGEAAKVLESLQNV